MMMTNDIDDKRNGTACAQRSYDGLARNKLTAATAVAVGLVLGRSLGDSIHWYTGTVVEKVAEID